MANEEINIAIAEACGIISEDQWGPIYKTPSGWVRDCPDYVNDLNAMNEAEAWLKKNDPHAFACYTSDLFEEHGSDVIHLYSARRAEAFLRTIGKWKEAQP